VLSWVFHCTMLTCFLRQKEGSHGRQILMRLCLRGHKKRAALRKKCVRDEFVGENLRETLDCSHWHTRGMLPAP